MYDITLADYPRFAGESSDDPRLRRALEACAGGVLYVPAGVYEVAEMITIDNCASLLLHKSAVLKAVREMPYVVKYDAAASYPGLTEKDWRIYPAGDPDSEDWNLFIKGGVFDGAGLASCLCLNSFKHFTLRDASFRNGKLYGIKVEDTGSMWTYELVAQNLYLKCTMSGLAGNAGISSNGGDSHYIDCIIVDYTKGFELLDGGSNRLTRCHVWGGPIKPRKEGELPEMLIDSVNFWIDSGDAVLTDCYADTGKIGYLVKKSARLFGCSYYNNYSYGMDDITVIKHLDGDLLVSGGMFRKTCPSATLYEGDKSKLTWNNDNILDGDWDDSCVVK